MIYVLLKSQDVSKLNTKGNIPVEFPNSKRDYKMLSQTSQCFLSLKNDLKVREPPFKRSYCLQTDVCLCTISSLFPFLTFNHSFILCYVCNCCMYSLCSDLFFINHSLISSSDTLILVLKSW